MTWTEESQSKVRSIFLSSEFKLGIAWKASDGLFDVGARWDWWDLKLGLVRSKKYLNPIQCKNGWLLPKRPFMGCLMLAPGLTWRRVVAVIFPLSSWEAETSVERWATLGLARPPGLEPELPEDGNFPTTTTEPPPPPPTWPQTEKTYSRAFGQGHFRSRNDNLPRFEEKSKSY